MAIDTTIDLLQTLNAGITGVVSAPLLAQYPTVLDTASLPMVIMWPTGGQFYIKGGGWKVATRTYALICWVAPIAQNDVPSNLAISAPLLQRFIDAYIDADNIQQAIPPTYQVTIRSGQDNQHADDGIRSDLTFGGKPYHGFIIHVHIHEQWL